MKVVKVSIKERSEEVQPSDDLTKDRPEWRNKIQIADKRFAPSFLMNKPKEVQEKHL